MATRNKHGDKCPVTITVIRVIVLVIFLRAYFVLPRQATIQRFPFLDTMQSDPVRHLCESQSLHAELLT